MQDIPFVSSGYRFMVTEAPTMKMREVKGELQPATDREGRPAFVVMLFAKPRHRSAPWADVRSIAADPESAVGA